MFDDVGLPLTTRLTGKGDEGTEALEGSRPDPPDPPEGVQIPERPGRVSIGDDAASERGADVRKGLDLRLGGEIEVHGVGRSDGRAVARSGIGCGDGDGARTADVDARIGRRETPGIQRCVGTSSAGFGDTIVAH